MRTSSAKRLLSAVILGLSIIGLSYVVKSPQRAITMYKNAIVAKSLVPREGQRSASQEKITKPRIQSTSQEVITTKSSILQTPKQPVIQPKKNGGEQVNVNFKLTQTRPEPSLNQYWSKILHFVPKENNHDCLNLFTTDTSKTINVTQGFYQAFDAINKELKHHNWLGGRAPQHKKLTLTYQALANQAFVHTVCEIGFNAGQSAIAWLTAKPGIVLYSFDIGTFPWTKPTGKVVKKLFPNQFNLTIGDSTVTVPIWAKLGKKCDIVSVDGGHMYPVVIKDLINMGEIAAKEHILIADDIYFPGVNKAWKEMRVKGVIKNIFDCWIHGLDIDFVIGYYIK